MIKECYQIDAGVHQSIAYNVYDDFNTKANRYKRTNFIYNECILKRKYIEPTEKLLKNLNYRQAYFVVFLRDKKSCKQNQLFSRKDYYKMIFNAFYSVVQITLLKN